MEFDFRDILQRTLGSKSESLQRIRMGRGVVGKISYVTAIALPVLGAVAYIISKSNPVMSFYIAIMIVAITLIYIVGVLLFSHKHPSTALLEGADLILWRQIDLAAKGITSPPDRLLIVDPKSPPQSHPQIKEPEK